MAEMGSIKRSLLLAMVCVGSITCSYFSNEEMHVIVYLQDVPQVSCADLRIFCGVERDRSYPDKGKDAGFRVPPQHKPRAILRLAVEHHLMGSWQSPGSCEKRRINNNIRITSLESVSDLTARLKREKNIWWGSKRITK